MTKPDRESASHKKKFSVRSNGSRKISKIFHEPSLTKQSHAEECDIHNILNTHASRGTLRELIAQGAVASDGRRYGDFSNPLTLQEAYNTVFHAEDQFMGLPATVRDEFQNDPVKFLQFTSDPKNIDRMVELGLATKQTTNKTTNDPVASPEAHTKKPLSTKKSDSTPQGDPSA